MTLMLQPDDSPLFNQRIVNPRYPIRKRNTRRNYEYGFGVGNIFKVFRIDFNFRGNYLDLPGARPFGITGSFGFFF